MPYSFHCTSPPNGNLPTHTNNYIASWHHADFVIDSIADLNINTLGCSCDIMMSEIAYIGTGSWKVTALLLE